MYYLERYKVIGKNGNLALSIFGTYDPTIPFNCMYQTEMYAHVHQEIKPNANESIICTCSKQDTNQMAINYLMH